MPAFCAVISCSDKYGHAEKVSFHRFPIKRPELLSKWLAFTEREKNWKPNSYSAICSRHFHDEDYNNNDRKKNLKRNAIPAIRHKNTKSNGLEKTNSATTDVRPISAITPIKTNNASSNGEHVPTHKPIILKIKGNQKDAASNTDSDSNSDSVSDTDSSTDETNESDDSERLQGNRRNRPKGHCRFCSELCAVATTFADNFEVYGIIQKCFPTLNIQQDDQLPKDICTFCLKHLKYFSDFIDKVLAAQNELIRKYQVERQDKKAERMLKIKQEPVVRVKQELPDYNHSLFSNLLDDEGDQEQDANAIDQKFPFDDLPLLNAQDVINDCDIMEIINLDDPFINIPDDDGNTANNEESVRVLRDLQSVAAQQKSNFPSPGQILTTHMLYEEHNYANILTNNLKQEWQTCNYYKTEKLEIHETQLLSDAMQQRQSITEQPAAPPDKRNSKPKIEVVSSLTISTTQVPQNIEKPPTTKPNIVVLNNEPICSSSNSFQLHACSVCHLKYFSLDSLNQHYANAHAEVQEQEEQPEEWCNFAEANNESANIASAQAMPNMCSKYMPAYDNAQLETFQANSSCVAAEAGSESSDYMQAVVEDGQFLMDHNDREENAGLEMQMECAEYEVEDLQTKSVSESATGSESGHLNQLHVDQADGYQNNAAPVINNEVLQIASDGYNQVHTIKQSYASGLNSEYYTDSSRTLENEHSNTFAVKLPDTHFIPNPAMQSNESYTTNASVIPYEQTKEPPLKKQKIFINDVNILNVQHSFTQITQPPCPPRLEMKFDEDAPLVQNTHTVFGGNAENNYQPEQYRSNMEYARLTYEQWEHIHYNETHVRNLMPDQTTLRTDRLETNIRQNTQSIKKLTTMYKDLRQLCLQLLHKSVSGDQKVEAKRSTKSKAKVGKHGCRICQQKFPCIRTLLRHKQNTPNHHVQKLKHFAARCFACAHTFYSRRAYNNHQRYLCLAVPLNHLSKRLRNYKCRWCGVIAFPHWRIYRHHVAKCKLKHRKVRPLQKRQLAGSSREAKLISSVHSVPCADSSATETMPSRTIPKSTRGGHRKKSSYNCTICNKQFPTSNSFYQHRITHTEARQYLCNLCPRTFKRRHGLKQHINSYHLDVKPFTCPICKRAYALKGDMRRCKHSLMKG